MPPTRHRHLQFTRLNEAEPRKKQGGGPRPQERHAVEHADYLNNSIAAIEASFATVVEVDTRIFDPELIFRATLTRANAVTEEQWEKAGLRVLSTQPKGTVVLFADATHLHAFKQKVEAYGGPVPPEQKSPSQNWLSNIEALEKWSREDRTGRKLAQSGIVDDAEYVVDVELWHLEDIDSAKEKLAVLRRFVEGNNGQYLDQYVSSAICLARIRVTGQIINSLLDELTVALVEFPPQPELPTREILGQVIDDFAPIPSPPTGAPSVCIIDSGINSGHPMLGPAIGDTAFVPAKIGTPLDNNGHGSLVGGLALYGDVLPFIRARKFVPELYLFSVRVTNESNRFDDETLIANQMRYAIVTMYENYNCRVFNISLGDPFAYLRDSDKQTIWAATLDELIRERDLVVVISAGNYHINADDSGAVVSNYVSHLLNNEDSRIIDPAMASLAITVGSLAHEEASLLSQTYQNDPAYIAVAKIDQPSPFTRRGPGYNGAIKPELCEYGGNTLWHGYRRSLVKDMGLGIVSTAYNSTGGRLFTSDSGTSFAAPRVAHFAARILGQYPDASANLVRSLLVASADVPAKTKELIGTETREQIDSIFNLCGYGKPDLARAMSSTDHRVTFYSEDELELDHYHIYEVPLPEEFRRAKGTHRISVSLAFDPLTRRTRNEYLGCRMSFRLYSEPSLDAVIEHVRAEPPEAVDLQDNGENTDTTISDNGNETNSKVKMFSMWPGHKMRHGSTVQKAVYEVSQVMRYPHDESYLVVWCERRWITDPDYRQGYSIVVTLECAESADVNLYQTLQIRLAQEVRPRIRV